MRYAGLIKNDVSAGPGICVSFFTQGCPIQCYGCHNPEAQDFNGGMEFTNETLNELIEALTANGIQRNLCIMGGEPLCTQNAFLTYMIVRTVREKVPKAKIYVWSGYTYDRLKEDKNSKVMQVLNKIDYLIDGPYIHALRDITLHMRGSSNQKIISLKGNNIYDK